MSSKQSAHYEILGRQGTNWTIVEVKNERKPAIDFAETLWNARQYEGVRVLKETFNPDNDQFETVEIYSRGGNKKQSKYDRTGEITPCLTPDDLYSADGRKSIWDLLGNTLSDWMLTATELLHNEEHYYKLYNAGTKLQDAVQRTAVSFEEEQGSIQERMRKIFKVVDLAVEIVKSNTADVPSLEMGRLKPLVAELEVKPNKKYLLTASIAQYLQPAVTVEDKFGRTIIFMTAGRPDWVMEILDQFIAEFFLHSKLLTQVLGEFEERGDFIKTLALLQSGTINTLVENQDDTGEADTKSDAPAIRVSDDIIRLNSFIASGSLPLTSRILFDRLRSEIEKPQPINGRGLVAQLNALDDIRLTLEDLKATANDISEIDDELSNRAGRLVNSQVIAETLIGIKDPFEQVHFLLDLEAVTPGLANKRALGNFIMPILTRPDFETIFVGLDQTQPMKRMPDIKALQDKVRGTELNQMQRRKIAEKLDSFCRTILDNTQVLKKLHKLDISLQKKSIKILTMIADGFFTEGECRDMAEHQVRAYMKTTGFTEGLLQDLPKGQSPQQALMNFRDLLEKADITKVTTG